ALLGQGIALGWLNVVSHWMRSGAMVPAVEEAIVTNRTCYLLHSAAKPLRAAAAEIRDWIVEEVRTDVAEVGRLYPGLRVDELLNGGQARAERKRARARQ